MKSIVILLCSIFVTTSKACLEVTSEMWTFETNRDLLFQDSSLEKCHSELFEHEGYMGFSFEVLEFSIIMISFLTSIGGLIRSKNSLRLTFLVS